MKLSKNQAITTFTALDFLAIVVGLVLMFANYGTPLSYAILCGVVAVCEFGKYKARQLPDEDAPAAPNLTLVPPPGGNGGEKDVAQR